MTAPDLPTWGAARIKPSSDGTYKPDPAGEPAIILAVTDSLDRWCDILAWFCDDPSKWWCLRDNETPVVGAGNLGVAAFYGGPIVLHSTPEQWLLAGGRGACVIRWDMPLTEIFEGVSRVDCDNPELRQCLLRALRRWEPRVAVTRQGVRRAA